MPSCACREGKTDDVTYKIFAAFGRLKMLNTFQSSSSIFPPENSVIIWARTFSAHTLNYSQSGFYQSVTVSFTYTFPDAFSRCAGRAASAPGVNFAIVQNIFPHHSFPTVTFPYVSLVSTPKYI
jgi:hypothetical protein